jgi:TolB-like protein
MSFLNELKRRNVLRVGAAYVVTAWLVIQVVETIFPAFGFGNAAIRYVTIAFAIGLLPALIVAWVFEWTPEGLKKEEEVDHSRSASLQNTKRLDQIILMVLALALGYFAFDKFVLDPQRDAENIEIASEVAVEQAFADVAAAQPAKSIAVLPFDNRSNLEEDQFFTDGIHDDLLTTIAKIGSIKVISRTSVMEYKGTTKKIPEIAKELGVANILEGGIQRSGKQIRINVQLIDAISDAHLWAETYDRELTAENLFAIQSEITKAIADALKTTLSLDEKQRIDTMPTADLVAFDAYLLGRQLMATRDPEKLKLASEEFNKAVDLDPEFALAWVGVADSSRLISVYGRDLAPEDSFPIREAAINHALVIDDKLGEAYASLGSLHADKNQDEAAEAAFKQAIFLSPNYATGWQWYSQSLPLNPESIDRQIELLNRAAELDPRSSIISMNLADIYKHRGLYSLAEHQYLKVLNLDPSFLLGYRSLIYFNLYELGRFDQAMVHALKKQQLEGESVNNLYQLADIYLNLDDMEAAEAIAERMKDLDAESTAVGGIDIAINVHKNKFDGARESLNWLSRKFEESNRGAADLGFWHLLLGDNTTARKFFLAANPSWLDPGQIQTTAELTNHGCMVSWLLINTGDAESGERLLQQTTAFFDETLPTTHEHVDIYHPEICYLTNGDIERALQSIETQLAHNHLYDWKLYHSLPMYELIRYEPRFQAASAERERRVAIQRDTVQRMMEE